MSRHMNNHSPAMNLLEGSPRVNMNGRLKFWELSKGASFYRWPDRHTKKYRYVKRDRTHAEVLGRLFEFEPTDEVVKA